SVQVELVVALIGPLLGLEADLDQVAAGHEVHAGGGDRIHPAAAGVHRPPVRAAVPVDAVVARDDVAAAVPTRSSAVVDVEPPDRHGDVVAGGEGEGQDRRVHADPVAPARHDRVVRNDVDVAIDGPDEVQVLVPWD